MLMWDLGFKCVFLGEFRLWPKTQSPNDDEDPQTCDQIVLREIRCQYSCAGRYLPGSRQPNNEVLALDIIYVKVQFGFWHPRPCNTWALGQ